LHEKLVLIWRKVRDWIKDYAMLTRTPCPVTGKTNMPENMKIQPLKKTLDDAKNLLLQTK
jgi:hypothetical protein